MVEQGLPRRRPEPLERGLEMPNSKAKTCAPRAPKFEGKCDNPKGHLYDCSDVCQSDQYTKMTKEIAEDVGRTSS
jgi:hypothetical protein